EAPAGGVGQEAVLPLPTRPVRGAEGVDEDVAAVVVERDAEPGRAEAVDALPAIREPAVQVVEATVRPVGPNLELRDRSRPVREAELPPTSRPGRRHTV